MDKLLLTLTLVAFSSGVFCNVAQNLTEDGSTAEFPTRAVRMCNYGTADSMLPRTKVLGGHVEFYNTEGKPCMQNAPGDYRVINRTLGAHKLYNQPAVTWNQARHICTGDGGNLAVIRSYWEDLFLLAWIQKENIAEAWIGIHDHFERGHWVTLTGESLTATGVDYWISGKPNYPDNNEDCGALDHSGGFTNLACDHWRSYFCKIDLC